MAKRTNTKATISGTSTGSVTETGIGVSDATTIGGLLSVTDPDAGENIFKTPMSSSLTGLYGNFTFNPVSGIWTYLLDNSRTATNALYGGQVVTDKLTVSSYDGTATRDILVTITGTNDAPTLTAGKASATLIEQGGRVKAVSTATITMSKADPDTGDTTSWMMTGWTLASGTQYTKAGAYGNARFDTSTGVVSYTLDNARTATDALRGGESASDAFALTVSDRLGATTTKSAVFAITGSNDAPVAVSDTLNAVQDTPVIFTAAQLLANDGDIDTPAANLKIASVSNASGGTVTLNAVAQTVSFTPTAGFSGTASFSYAISDGTLTSAAVVDHVIVAAGDTTPPAAPSVALAVDTGASATDAITANATLNVGNVESGATVTFRAGGSSAWTSSAPAPVEGGNTVYVRQTDAAGNVSPSSSISFTYDSTVPVLQSAVVDGNTLTLTYTEAGSLDAASPPPASAFAVSTTDGARTVMGVSVNGATNSVTLTLSVAVNYGDQVTVSYADPGTDNDANAVQDIAGNDAATITAVAVNNITRDTIPPVITGPSGAAGAASAVISVPENSTAVWTFSAADSQTTWNLFNGADLDKFSINLLTGLLSFKSAPDFEHPTDVGTNNVYEVVVTATDQAGNVSTQSLSVTVTNVDDTPVPSAIAAITGMSRDSGASGSDFITNDGSAGRTVNGSLSGALGPDEVVQVSFNNGVDWSNALVTGSTWTATDNDSHAESWTIRARVYNPFGPVSGPVSTQFVTLDQAAPVLQAAAVNGSTLTLSYADAGSLDDVNLPDTHAFSVLVNGSEDSVSAVAVDGASRTLTLTLSAPVNYSDTVSVSYTDPSTDNDQAALQDLAGNDAGSYADYFATNTSRDTVAPIITGPSGAAGAATVYLSIPENSTAIGTFSANERVGWELYASVDKDLFDFDPVTHTLAFKSAPNFEISADADHDNVYEAIIAAADSAGNVAKQTVLVTVTDVDEIPPAAPAVALAVDTGISSSDMISADATLAIGNLEPGATLSYSTSDGAPWSLMEGQNTVIVRQTDAAGNVSDPTSISFTYDTTAPSFSLDGNGTLLPVDSNIMLNFSEDIVPGDGYITISNGSDTRNIPVNDARVTFTGSSVTINPTTNLQTDSIYVISFDTGTFLDKAGNAAAGTDPFNPPFLITQAPPNIYLNELNGANGFLVMENTASEHMGVAVSDAGDVNGDGFGDVIIGTASSSGTNGASYLIFGKASGFDASINLSTMTSATGIRLTGSTGSFSGHSVSAAGDINQDHFDDLIVGAAGLNSGGGGAYVIYGQQNWSGSAIDLSTLNASTSPKGFRMLDGNGDSAGYSVSGIGNFNGDSNGYDDLVIGTPTGSLITSGQFAGYATAAYVVFGKGTAISNFSLATMNSSTGLRLVATPNTEAGHSVSGAGDFNGDGIADLVIGAPKQNGNSGAAYVVFGTTVSATINLATLSPSAGVKLLGANSEAAGYAVSSAGDIDGDGIDDLIIGAPGLNGGSSASYLVYGSHSYGTSSDPNFSTIDLSNPADSRFTRLTGADGSRTGASVSGAGDLNGDGIDDLIIGAPSASTDNLISNGTTYIVFGKEGGLGDAVSLADLHYPDGFLLNGMVAGMQYGSSVSAAGDVNNDGIDDLIIGAPFADPNNALDSGASYILFGSPTIGNPLLH